GYPRGRGSALNGAGRVRGGAPLPATSRLGARYCLERRSSHNGGGLPPRSHARCFPHCNTRCRARSRARCRARGRFPAVNDGGTWRRGAHRTDAVELPFQSVSQIAHLRRLRMRVGVLRAQSVKLRFDSRQLRFQLAFHCPDPIISIAELDLVLQILEPYFEPGHFDAQPVLEVFDPQSDRPINAHLFNHLAQLLALLFPILLPILLPLFPLLRVELERLPVEVVSEDARRGSGPGARNRHWSEELSVQPPDALGTIVDQLQEAAAVHIGKSLDGELAHGRIGIVLGDLNQFVDGFAAPVVRQRADDVLLHLLVLQSVVNLDQGVRAFVPFDVAEITDGPVAQFFILLRFGDGGQLGDGFTVVYFGGAAFTAQQVTDDFAFDLHVAGP